MYKGTLECLGDYVAKIGENSLDFYAEDSSWPEVKRVAEEQSFFHWDLEFIDIFYDEDGKRKKNAGFDSVVGNPPYGAKLTKIEQAYYKQQHSQVGSTDTAQLMVFLALRMLSGIGTNGFIVPKALVFASNWKNTRKKLLESLTSLIDCKKVWNEVKLEQIVYVWNGNQNNSSYMTGSRTNSALISDTKIDKKMCDEFSFFPCGIKQDEIALGEKIHRKSELLSKYVENSRGCMLQNKVKEKGDNKVLGGVQVQRYYLSKTIKGYLNTKDINSKKAYAQQNSILAQRIVSHVENPTDHIKITAVIPDKIDFVILDTINQIIVKNLNPYYVLGLLNSKIINWYVYRFIFAKAIRTMQFDNPTTNKIPIIIQNEKKISSIVQELTQHMQKTMSHKTQNMPTRCADLINELNCMFYEIFGLTKEEIRMVEASTPE